MMRSNEQGNKSFTHPLSARLSALGTLPLLPGLLHHCFHLHMKQSEKEHNKVAAEGSFEPEGLGTSGCLVPLLPPQTAHHLKLRAERKRLVFDTVNRKREKQPNIDR